MPERVLRARVWIWRRAMVGVTDGRMAVPRSELPPRPGILYMNGPAVLGGFAATIRRSGNMRWQNAKIERWGETCPVDSHYFVYMLVRAQFRHKFEANGQKHRPSHWHVS